MIPFRVLKDSVQVKIEADSESPEIRCHGAICLQCVVTIDVTRHRVESFSILRSTLEEEARRYVMHQIYGCLNSVKRELTQARLELMPVLWRSDEAEDAFDRIGKQIDALDTIMRGEP